MSAGVDEKDTMATGTPTSPSLVETVAFVVHAIKQMCWGFERLNGIADDYQDGSAAKATRWPAPSQTRDIRPRSSGLSRSAIRPVVL